MLKYSVWTAAFTAQNWIFLIFLCPVLDESLTWTCGLERFFLEIGIIKIWDTSYVCIALRCSPSAGTDHPNCVLRISPASQTICFLMSKYSFESKPGTWQLISSIKRRSPEGLEFQAVSAWGLSLTANCCCTFQQHKTSSLLFNGFDGQILFFSTISVLWWAMLLFILCHIDWWSSPFRIISLDEVYPLGSLSHTLEPFLMWNMPYVQERNPSLWIISYYFLPCFL